VPTDLQPTPSQTVGPFFQLGLEPLAVSDLTRGASGEPITIQGAIFDGNGAPVPDAIIETWQADGSGAYSGSTEPGSFRGFGRVATDDAGRYQLRTVMPGAVPGPGGAAQAPHLVIAIFMRGLLRHLVTRVYFEHEADNAADPILNLVAETRRQTLIAAERPGAAGVYTWNVRLQGQDETVFFDV
jgi:protocatechuate 3,4-dioxygenase alpha subunit